VRVGQSLLEKGYRDLLKPPILALLAGAVLAICAGACSPERGKVSQATESNLIGAIKIVVDQEGLFGVSQDELEQGVPDDVFKNPEGWQLLHQGKAINYWIEGEGKNRALIFYGWPSSSLYTRENNYWLRLKGAPGYISASTETSSTDAPTDELAYRGLDSSYLETVRIEENKSYLPQSDGEDHWFWMPLIAPATADFDITLDALTPGPARIRVSVWASSEAAQNPDHHVLIKVNGNPVADTRWDGKGVHVIEGEFTTEFLNEGTNQISIRAPGDTGAVVELAQLDWIELDYSRQPKAIDGRLIFKSSGTPVTFEGFSGAISIYDISDEYHVRKVGDDLQGSAPFSGEAGKRYLVVEPEGVLRPKRIDAGVMEPDLRSPGSGADYLAIGPADLIDAMQPLIELRESQGYRVGAIPVKAVYDQFGDGSPTPQAIHDFVNYAVKSWQPAPRFVALVGDASYDPKNYLGMAQANQMPAYLITTEFGGETSSDTGFIQLNDDLWPDIATGIIPARTPEQIAAYVEKVLRYEKELPPVTTPMSLLAIADGQDVSFKSEARSFLDQFPGERFPGDLFAPPAGASDAQQQIIALFKQDFSLIAYFGHGSIDMWGKDRLFTAEGVAQLSALKHLPVVLNFTCLTGLYTHPKVDALAETFLWQVDGGAVAVLAPSSLTLPYDQGFLSRSLARLITDNPGATIGELHLKARRETPVDNSGGLDVMRTFMLFGDPALRLRGD
jgi:hypothetical protein